MKFFFLLFIGLAFFSCNSNQDQEINARNNNAIVNQQQQAPRPAQTQAPRQAPRQAPTNQPVNSNVATKKNIPNKEKRQIAVDEDMKPYLTTQNQTQAYQSKVSSEAEFFLSYLDGIVNLTAEQKSTIKDLAVKNISVKLKLLEDRTKLMAQPNSDKKEIRTISKAIAYQHQEERKYLKEVLTADQFESYVEFQNKKKRDRLNKLKKK